MTGPAAEQFPPPFPPLPPNMTSWPPTAPLSCLGSAPQDSLGALPPPIVPAPPAMQAYPTLQLVVPTRLVGAASRFDGVEKGEANDVVRGILGPEEADATQLIMRGMTKDDLEATIYAMLRAFETYNASGEARVCDDELHVALKVPYTVAELLLSDCSARLKALCRISISPLRLVVDHRVLKDGVFAEQFITLRAFPEALYSVLPVLSALIQEETSKCEREALLVKSLQSSSGNVANTLIENRMHLPMTTVVPEAAVLGAAAVQAAPWHAPATPWTADTPSKGLNHDGKREKMHNKNLARPLPVVSSTERASSPPKKKSASDGRIKDKRSDKEGMVRSHPADGALTAAQANSVGSPEQTAGWHQGASPGIYQTPNYPKANGSPWLDAHVSTNSATATYGVPPMSPAYGQWPQAPFPQGWTPPPHPYNGHTAPVCNGAGQHGEQNLKEWLRSLDGGSGALLVYHAALTENFETVDDLEVVERGHDGSIPDNQFFEDIKVTRDDHREIFRRWFVHRLQSRK